MQNLAQLIAARAVESGDKTYLIFKDRSYSFAQMERQVKRLARGLAGLGIGRGDRVAMLVGNSPEFIWTWWAILALGAVMVPLNLRLTAREAAYIIGHSKSKLLVVDQQGLPLVPDLKDSCPRVEHWLSWGGGEGLSPVEELPRLEPEMAPVEVGLDDEAVIIYTSGTTGAPKGVVHTHGNYLRTAASFAATCGLDPGDRLLTANPLFHVNAQFYSCLGTLWAGATFVLAERFSASRMWGWTRRYQTNKVVMLLALTTILYNREPRPDDADNPVELVVAGGAPRGHYHDFERRFGVKLQTLYSLSESPLALMAPLDQPCREGSVGLPMIPAWPGLENQVKIFDDQDHELPPGQVGQIVIRNQAMMKGYLDDPQATQEALAGGWLHTGDRGRRDEDGWFYFLGRAKDVIRKKGENISAAEVEAVLTASPLVAEAAVLGVSPPDAAGEEDILALVVPAAGAPVDWTQLVAHCRRELADFKIPRFWRALESLPKNATGRIMKDKLREGGALERVPGTFDSQKGVVA